MKHTQGEAALTLERRQVEARGTTAAVRGALQELVRVDAMKFSELRSMSTLLDLSGTHRGRSVSSWTARTAGEGTPERLGLESALS